MPSKSMNSMPMQSKIGDASLKFGPDWLRALSSDNSTGGTGIGTGSSGGGQSGGGWSSGSGGGGGSGERATNERSSSTYHHHQSSNREREKEPAERRYSNNMSSNTNNNSGSAPSTTRFKLAEVRYTREELLTLYDKNLHAPDFLISYGNLYIEKMQPPLAFSQPSEEELRTWHVAQPESSRQTGSVGTGLSPLSRGGGFVGRGRGAERGSRGGRGGRGGYYSRPHEEEEQRSSFRPHSFSRSQSAHERNWVPDRERNGLAGSPPEGETNHRGGGSTSSGGGGNWRNRNSDSYSKGRFEESEDGWRNKPRWRREDEEDYTPRPNPRRINKSWSDDGTQDNLPEWAKDNPSEESGTFDSSGAFHDEDRYSAKTNAFEISRRSDTADHPKDSKEDSHGSQNERVQKRNTERTEKSLLPSSVKEEEEETILRKPQTKEATRKSVSPTPEPSPETRETTESKSSSIPQEPLPSPPQTTLPEPKPQLSKSGDEEHYFSMIEDADSLVAKLIEDDAALLRLRGAPEPNLSPVSSVSGNAPTTPQTQPLPTPTPGSVDVWFYRDPQGNVQGPFATPEMSLWFTQGYFSGGLFLRRECDNVFITLSEMGKLYGRNPFISLPDSNTPPPLQDPSNGTSALDPETIQSAQAQYLQKKQQQLFQAQHQQYLLNLIQQNQSPPQPSARKESEGWLQLQGGGASSSQLQQARIILSNMAKPSGSEGNALDHFQALFQRQTQTQTQLKGPEKNIITDFRNTNLPPQLSSQNETKGSLDMDPIQSLLHQLTNMTNPQSGAVGLKSGGNEWGSGGMSSWNAPAAPPSSSNALWDYREQYLKMQQMKAEEELLARKKAEEEQERKRLQEEEEARKRLEEQKRIEIEQEQKRKAYEELLQQQQAAAAELARQREEMIIQQRLQQQELARQRQEQERQLEKQRVEAIQKLEQQRAEQHRLEQARLEKEREEEREREREREREEQERRLQMELAEQKRREERRMQQELQLKKLQELQLQQQQQQQQQQKMPWSTGNGSKTPRTLLEIQEEEALQFQREEAQKAQQMAQKKKQEEELRLSQQNKGLSLTWAQPILPQKTIIKSLAEIQAEEAATLEEKRRDKEIQTRHLNLQQTWTSNLTWANRASLNAPPPSGKANGGGGVWDEGRKKWETENPPPFLSNKPQHSSVTAPTIASMGKQQRPKEASSEDAFLKLFQDHGLNLGGRSSSSGGRSHGAEDHFTRWCFEMVNGIGSSVDVPTFINFLKEVESPYEVNDYIRSYLGDGKEARDFCREFLERRSRWKNARRGGEKEGKSFEDNLCRPASALNPPSAEFQEVKGKKGKKGKMQKVDARILGFNTTAAPDRLNVGKRDYGDGSDN